MILSNVIENGNHYAELQLQITVQPPLDNEIGRKKK
jgi:hypothetical protein